MPARLRPAPTLILVTLALAVLSLVRPLDHDESQYVAAAALSADGLLPYRDYAYLQTPLQPLLFAPIAALAGTWTWPALRLANALLAALAVIATYVAARRAGASERSALIAALGFAVCDILLFSAATARNDALPVAMLAGALALIAGPAPNRTRAFATGLLLAGAAAAKISYALPAAAWGIWALTHRAHRPLWVAAGALPAALLTGWLWSLAPDDFVFGTLTFPAQAPADYYADRPWKLSLAAKAVDTLKFLALGPALLAIIAAAGHRVGPWPWLALAGLVAALLPEPTWRQYLLPMLPPLFVAAALAIDHARPEARIRRAAPLFVVAGLAPSLIALFPGAPAMLAAMRESAAIRAGLDTASVRGPVATLSPQFLPATGRRPDPRFATGPFAFRIRAFLPPSAEAPRRIITPRTLSAQFDRQPPAAILTGGEARWTSGSDALESPLDHWAQTRGWRAVPLDSTRFRLWTPPQAARARRAATSVS
ncbi:DUF2029 domain-containing protein [Sphingomonas sp.]|uniref:DUF2029 domain-containing protein n=1 Tax=Sphingomonas sp. TaxID=28214 RepID=UPI002C6F4B69|nr:DUF2029 domain-containing protein [Sphingomonas sp.]HTG39497.1 DUF2029 domain-containing protein [Sphingomonas sp.]